ncbi:DivIVA domain-containing protein [Dactylosporangium sp. NBC_01737]|uniref:DivIVA domain-containing protein n=1 Tax=Dactylosporangium sp. NBC_01737 TaxID=2975959 RepID=UPI002E166022|nr:DivIVA domain-containing protein [Dactylosporangium sp. NBC_01737]
MISFEFSVVLRGYDPRAVDALLAPAVAALTAGEEDARVDAAAALRRAALPVVLRGFDRAQVDAAIARLAAQLEGAAGPAPVDGLQGRKVEFDVVLRGYDAAAVDRLVEQVGRALAGQSATARAEAAAAVRQAVFALRFRGYARHQVDAFLQQAAKDLR